jgi:hypothetical protein
VSAGPCTLCGGDHARSACPWAKPAADLRAAIGGIRARPTPLSAVIPAAQAAADSLERAGAEIARLRRALDNRVPIDTAAELRWRVVELNEIVRCEVALRAGLLDRIAELEAQNTGRVSTVYKLSRAYAFGGCGGSPAQAGPSMQPAVGAQLAAQKPAAVSDKPGCGSPAIHNGGSGHAPASALARLWSGLAVARPLRILAWLQDPVGCSGACDQGRRPCTCDRATAMPGPEVEPWHLPHMKDRPND